MADTLSNRDSPEAPALANLNDKFVFILGGTFRKIGTTDYYDVDNNVWTLGPKMTKPRYAFSACILAGILYAFSGATPGYSNIESLDAHSLVNGKAIEW